VIRRRRSIIFLEVRNEREAFCFLFVIWQAGWGYWVIWLACLRRSFGAFDEKCRFRFEMEHDNFTGDDFLVGEGS